MLLVDGSIAAGMLFVTMEEYTYPTCLKDEKRISFAKYAAEKKQECH
jgi:hypothetical protein